MEATPAHNIFLAKHKEKEDFNQYWYSQSTINAIVTDSALRASSWVFDYDKQWSKEQHFCFYDFNKPNDIPSALHGQFDCVVIDPPFITEAVWEKYTEAAQLLLKPDGKVIGSTVAENAPFMQKLLNATPVPFKPSIPHLVYQYNLYTNFPPTSALSVSNPEIVEDD